MLDDRPAPVTIEALVAELLALKEELRATRDKSATRFRIAAVLAIGAIVLAATVKVRSSDLEVRENPDGGPAGSPSYQLRLVGRSNNGGTPADRAMQLQTFASAATDTYRLGILDNVGNERVTVSYDGYIGVGETNPGLALDIHKTTDAAYLRLFGTGDATNYAGVDLRSDEATDKVWQFAHKQAAPNQNKLIATYFDGTSWLERLTIDTAGNLGVGTTAPGTLFSARRDFAGNQAIAYFDNLAGASGPGEQPDTADLHLRVGYNNGTAIGSSILRAGKEEDFTTAGRSDSFLAFLTTQDTVAAEKMRLTSAGYLLIGTTEPGTYLTVRKDTLGGPQALAYFENRAGISAAGPQPETADIHLRVGYNSGGNVGSIILRAGKEEDFSNSTRMDGFLALLTCEDGVAAERMRITSIGFTGVGTTSPDTRLDVAGAFSMREMAAPAVSPADQGRIYFDATANRFRVSENGGAYQDLVQSGSGSGDWVDIMMFSNLSR